MSALISLTHIVKPTRYKRAKNWIAPKPAFLTLERAINKGRYSCRCSYTRWEYRQEIECWGEIHDGVLTTHIGVDGGTKNEHYPPIRGWHWAEDEFGICLKNSKGQEYHPTSGEFLANNTYGLAKIARHNIEIRRGVLREQKKEQKKEREFLREIRRAEKRGFHLCLADSLQAGNCRGGTEGFLKRESLQSESGHLRPTKLLPHIGDSRVKAVLFVGYRRFLRELRQGFSEVSYHTTK
jgi:hypothetical protein